MKIVKADVEIVSKITGTDALKHLELCGRECYHSQGNITADSAKRFVGNIIRRGHESVLEHVSITVRFTVDRGVSHEIVRHRIASFSQESTRYCNYSLGKFGSEITVIEPCFWKRGSDMYNLWRNACALAERQYLYMIDCGATPQEARTVLPHSVKTGIMMTANIREWRHFLKLRCAEDAHPQMREVALKLLLRFHELIPVCFDDLWEKFGGAAV